MNKSILLLGAIPLVCGTVGFGAGTFLKPGAAPKVQAAGHTDATNVLDKLAGEAAAPVEEHPPVPAAHDDDGAKAEPEKAHQTAEHTPAKAESHAKPEAHAKAETAEKPDAHEQVAEAKVETDAHAPDPEAFMNDKQIVHVGRISVPVYKPNSITYVIAEFGVAVEDQEQVAHYSIAENAIRLRDAIMTSMHNVATTPMLMGPAIDSDVLADTVATDLKPEFEGVKDVLFLSLHKTDVPRS